jgi:hypothetical protein
MNLDEGLKHKAVILPVYTRIYYAFSFYKAQSGYRSGGEFQFVGGSSAGPA